MLRAESDIASGHGVSFPQGFDSFNPLDQPPAEIGWLAPEEQPDNAFTRPAGLVWSTASDQARLLGFLIDGNRSVLSDALRQALTTAQAPVFNHWSWSSYGYGVFVEGGYRAADGSFYEVPSLSHGGATMTMRSASLMLPEQRVAVSVLANGSGEEIEPVAQAALEAAAEGRLPAASEAPAPPAAQDLASYAGDYVDPVLGEVLLSWDEDHLSVHSPALSALEVAFDPVLQPLARDLFQLIVGEQPYLISFYDGADGVAHEFGVNREFVLTRLPAPSD
jgi:CubicO group peptidase (beta-lactamase class C family)